MTLSLRRSGTQALIAILALLMAGPARAQVGGTPAPPVTLWQFLGIPQGIKKLQGATRNRRGNHPNLEPKPPMRAIADPRNLESPDPSIKKAAEVKTAEDLKAQKIKAVKYLASIGCGCYDADGGVTAALAASMQDCTEDVRYETINAVAEAAENGACARCGEGCCCNKEILTVLAKLAYERKDDGCYLEPSARVRQAAAEALRICCPTSTPPLIVPAEPQPQPEEREAGETVEPDDSREAAPLPTPPAPPAAPPATPVPSVSTPRDGDDYWQSEADAEQFAEPASGEQAFDFGVVVHVSSEHRLAHVHFSEANMVADVGVEIGVYAAVGQQRELIARLHVVEAFAGSANVTGTPDDLANIQRGDLVLLPRVTHAAQLEDAASAEWTSSADALNYGVKMVSSAASQASPHAVSGESSTTAAATAPTSQAKPQNAGAAAAAAGRPPRVSGYVR